MRGCHAVAPSSAKEVWPGGDALDGDGLLQRQDAEGPGDLDVVGHGCREVADRDARARAQASCMARRRLPWRSACWLELESDMMPARSVTPATMIEAADDDLRSVFPPPTGCWDDASPKPVPASGDGTSRIVRVAV